MGIFNKLIGYRWSLYIIQNDRELVYVMHENNPLRMIGYVMNSYANGATPVQPWSLYLNFNKNHQSFKLCSEHFTSDGENVTNTLLEKITEIDPNWRVTSNEPVFMEARSKKHLPISQKRDYSSLKVLIESTEAPKEETFFSVMRKVFGKD